jgi:hypothetical protein
VVFFERGKATFRDSLDPTCSLQGYFPKNIAEIQWTKNIAEIQWTEGDSRRGFRTIQDYSQFSFRQTSVAPASMEAHERASTILRAYPLSALTVMKKFAFT